MGERTVGWVKGDLESGHSFPPCHIASSDDKVIHKYVTSGIDEERNMMRLY